MAEWDRFRISIEADQTLRMAGSNGFLEPICPVCNTPIAWVLDMMSFKHDDGTFVACHARCVWTPEAFDNEHHRGTQPFTEYGTLSFAEYVVTHIGKERSPHV